MNKELLFNEMVDNIINSVTLAKFEQGKLISEYENILINFDNKKYYLAYVSDKFEDEKIHGNARNKLAKEFIELYNFKQLKDLYNKNIDEYNKSIEIEENNKYKLDELYIKIAFMEKYNNEIIKSIEKIHFDYGLNKFYIKFQCKKNNYEYESIEIYNNSDYENFEFRYNYKSEVLTIEQVIAKLNTLSIDYEKYMNEQKKIKKGEELERDRKIKIQNKVFELYDIGKEIIFKNKNSFIGFKKGLRYAIGEGKAGRYYNCDYSQLYSLINKKNINQYIIIDDEIETYNLTNKELENLPYINII